MRSEGGKNLQAALHQVVCLSQNQDIEEKTAP